MELLDGLSGCQNIQSFDVDVDYRTPKSTREIKHFLMSCQNLKVLRLRAPWNFIDEINDGHPRRSDHGVYDLCVEQESNFHG